MNLKENVTYKTNSSKNPIIIEIINRPYKAGRYVAVLLIFDQFLGFISADFEQAVTGDQNLDLGKK